MNDENLILDDALPGAGSVDVISVSEAPEPIDQKLRYGTSLHGTVLAKLKQRIRLAEDFITTRVGSWSKVDSQLRLFVDPNEKATGAAGVPNPNKRENPFARPVIIPASLAAMSVRLVQMLSIFAARDPYLPYTAAEPRAASSVPLVEALVQRNMLETQFILTMYSFLQDADRYGIGIIHDGLREVKRKTIQRKQGLMALISSALSGEPPTEVVETSSSWVNWDPVDPYSSLPDPRVSPSDLQDGEFYGHTFRELILHLAEDSMKHGGFYFNLEQAAKQPSSTLDPRGEAGTVAGGPSTEAEVEQDSGRFIKVYHLEIKLIPSEWKLGDSDRPQTWIFELAGSDTQPTVIIRAHETPYYHGEFSYSAAQVNPDPHTAFSPGSGELSYGLQKIIDWMFNSHVANVRRFLNNAGVVAPSLINMKDILSPGPGGHIRLTALGEKMLIEGRLSMNNLFMQLPVADVTKEQLNTGMVMFDFLQRMLSTSDPQMGQPLPSKRTLGEVKQVTAYSSNRIASVCRLIDDQATSKLANRAVSILQQFTSGDEWVSLADDAQDMEGVRQLTRVTPDALMTNVVYQSLPLMAPPDPASMAQTYLALMETASKIPQLMDPRISRDGRTVDLRFLFNQVVKRSGVKNVSDLYQQAQVQPPQVMPDAQVQQQVAAGNLIPH